MTAVCNKMFWELRRLVAWLLLPGCLVVAGRLCRCKAETKGTLVVYERSTPLGDNPLCMLKSLILVELQLTPHAC